MEKRIMKIKGVDCEIGYLADLEGQEEIYCHGNDNCRNCCGLSDCECHNN